MIPTQPDGGGQDSEDLLAGKGVFFDETCFWFIE